MPLTSHAVAEFVATGKEVQADERMTWRRRNVKAQTVRLGVVAGGVVVGELVLVVNLDAARNWTFALARQREEVLRWDLSAPPMRHRNPPSRPAGYKRAITALEHEHRWEPGLRTACAVELPNLASADHRQALAAFCDRANITFNARYEAPPPPGEQLQMR